MNYNSIQEILSAGTTNMEVLRDNVKQNDGVDTITGVSWFTYNGTTASTIYASGNSFIGFGSSAEHLKVNRRDGALYSLYREEGTLYNYYKFLKIRWKGHSAYNLAVAASLVEYDVILWDTGDISLHMVSIPTTQANGTYSLVASSTYNYTVSTSSPDVTFTKTDSGFAVSNNIINLTPVEYYLIRSNSDYYTVVDNALSSITVSDLTSNTFETFGVLELPPVSLLTTLTNPELLYWHVSNTRQLTDGLIVTGSPLVSQILYYDAQDMTNHIGIEKVICTIFNDAVVFSVSIDDGQSWKYYSNGAWVNATTDLEGMNMNTMFAITADQWSEIITSATPYRFRCASSSVIDNVGKIYVKYNDGLEA